MNEPLPPSGISPIVAPVVGKPPDRPLAGPNVLLMGPAGTGKTYSLGTLVDWAQAHNKSVYVLFTEQGLESLLGYWLDELKDPATGKVLRPARPVPACLHWHQTITQPVGLDALIAGADLVSKLSYKAVTEWIDPDRGKNNPFWKILVDCKTLPSDRDGTSFGNLAKLGTDKILVMDGLSELSNAAMKMQIGAKPTASPGDYGVAQNSIMNFLRLVTQGIDTTFVLIAHVSKEMNEVTGSTLLGVKSAGKALAGEIPQLFSDVIYTVREGTAFYWDTAAFGVDTKTRSLGYRSKITPDFAQIMDTWIKRGGK